MGLNLYQIDPMRAPRWRADLAIRIVQQGAGSVHPGASEDEYVEKYVQLLKVLSAAEAERSDFQQVRLSMPHLFGAHSLYYSQDGLCRSVLEAWLLTSESFDQIAKRCGLDALCVEAYESTFFNVKDRLRATDWVTKSIHDSVAGSALEPGDAMTEDDIGLLLRLFGYFGGPLILEHLIGAIVPEKSMGIKNEIFAGSDDTLVQTIALRAAASLQHFSLNARNSLRLMRLAVKTRAAAIKAQRATHRDH